MDTNEYETFEYLQPNNDESLTKRLFVVQDNGTYLSFDRNVDLSEVQNVELLEEVQPVYDVSPEQFYIDVDGSQEIVTVSEQFVLSNDLHNEDNIYENNLMLHESSSTNIQIQPVDQIPENVVEQFIKKEPSNAEINMEMDTAPSGFTEVMLSDEQYKFLEQRGWTLVESNDNIFFIDGLGLHNITNNDQLIQDLKQKMKDNEFTDRDSSSITETIVYEEDFVDNGIEPTIEYIEGKKQKRIDDPKLNPIKILPKLEKKPKEVPDLMPSEREFLETTVNELSEKYENRDPSLNSNTIKIKTKFSLKDIPSEIVLGKTVNGKKLIARVTKREQRDSKTDVHTQRKSHKTYQTNAFDHKIEMLIQQTINGEVSPVTDKDVIDNADRLVLQLLRVPAFKPAVIGKRLIITKISIIEDKEQNPKKEIGPILITGQVVNKGNDTWSFQYIPDMLRRLKDNGCEQGSKNAVKNKSSDSVDITFLQIHIHEVIGPDGCAKCSITLNRRVIIVKCKKSNKSRKTEKQCVYTCDTCVAIFNTECKLLEHQELHNVADNLKTNTVRTNAMYTTTNLGLDTSFKCNQCQFQTSKQSIIHRHIKSHFNTLINTEKPNNALEDKYNCKLCSDSFLNATSLSNHIVSSHIKVIET